ncbi:MAG TPA: hypothetical protein VFR85_08345 [Anaeromyxobacteraceae bacterium]|nr:hypothetical protein [Anaeromyxobacteraceae bacterium]
MTRPTVSAALGLGWRAAVRHAWLAPVGMVAALSRTLLAAPVAAFAWYLAGTAAALRLQEAPLPEAALEAAVDALTSPRGAALIIGLWAGGSVLAWAARLAWLAGALPTLGQTLAGRDSSQPLFALGVAYGLPRLLGTAALAWILEMLGSAFSWGVALASLLVTVRARAMAAGPGAAAVVAAALTFAVAVPLLVAAVGDAALGRAAILGEGPARAVGRAALRVANRPAAFLLAGLAVALFGALAAGSIQGIATAATGFARARAAWLMLGPDMVVAVTAALVAAWVELWRLGVTAVLGCAD